MSDSFASHLGGHRVSDSIFSVGIGVSTASVDVAVIASGAESMSIRIAAPKAGRG
jgi:hypothetical protein